jgi:uncharacterized membrane protein YeaQ/YmgE (transglycosylase-associated protein family)
MFASPVVVGRALATRRRIVITFIIIMIFVGLIAGFIARAVVPGPDPMGILGTVVLGIVGSFIGGFLGYILFHKDITQGAFQPSGLFGSIIGAIIALLIYRTTIGRRSRRI